MKKVSILKVAALSLACWGFLFPQAGLSASDLLKFGKQDRTEKALPILDVAMGPGGSIVGHVVDDRGLPLDGAVVTLHRGKTVVAKTVTDKNGVFVAKGLRAGMYQVSAGQGSGLFRCWAPNTAPPSARTSALIVSSRQVVRGQDPFGLAGVGGLSGLQLVSLAGTVATLTITTINASNTNDIADDVNTIEADVAAIKAQSP